MAVARNHRKLGHAQPRAMVWALNNAGTYGSLLNAARHWKCEVCEQQQVGQPRPPTTNPIICFNQRLGIYVKESRA